MTPYEIGVLIHCYVSPTKHPQSDTKLFQQTIEMLMNEDMVYELEDHYKIKMDDMPSPNTINQILSGVGGHLKLNTN